MIDRWLPVSGQTLCYAHFKSNEVAINEYFWHIEGIMNDAVAKSSSQQKDLQIRSIFDYGADKGNRKDTLFRDFCKIMPENRNLFRLFALVACASYFEHYLNQGLRLALFSNIGVIFGQSRTLDGTKVLKAGENFPFQAVLKEMIQNRWNKRYKKIKDIFGVEINSIKNNIPFLEKERIRRNMIAHQFGLDGDIRFIEKVDLSFFEQNKIQILEQEVVDNFRIIRNVVDEMEKKIVAPNIGVFEIILFVHYYKKNIDDFRTKMPVRYKGYEIRKLISAFSMDNGAQNISREKAQEIIDFYDNA